MVGYMIMPNALEAYKTTLTGKDSLILSRVMLKENLQDLLHSMMAHYLLVVV